MRNDYERIQGRWPTCLLRKMKRKGRRECAALDNEKEGKCDIRLEKSYIGFEPKKITI